SSFQHELDAISVLPTEPAIHYRFSKFMVGRHRRSLSAKRDTASSWRNRSLQLSPGPRDRASFYVLPRPDARYIWHLGVSLRSALSRPKQYGFRIPDPPLLLLLSILPELHCLLVIYSLFIARLSLWFISQVPLFNVFTYHTFCLLMT